MMNILPKPKVAAGSIQKSYTTAEQWMVHTNAQDARPANSAPQLSVRGNMVFDLRN